MLYQIYTGWKLSWSYFTIIPVNFSENTTFDKTVYRYMLLFFPFTGAVLALISSALYQYILIDLQWFGALISASIYMMLYGFLHTEAISDVADAIYASHSGKDSYDIIKEPTIGAMGLFWGLIMTLLKLGAVVYLFLNFNPFLLIMIAVSSRISLLILIKSYHFRSSFVTLLKDSLNSKNMLLAIILYSTLLFWFFGEIFAIPLFISVIISYISSKMIEESIGFINGDVLGASLEIAEVVSLTGLALWL